METPPNSNMSKLHQDNGSPRSFDGQKVCIATTSYDRCTTGYTFSMASSREALHGAGIGTAYLLLRGNCHVDDARNRIVQEFLTTDCTDLVFIDADVEWHSSDLVKLCQYDLDVVGGVYPYRRKDKQEELPMRMMKGKFPVDGLMEVEGLPTGFLRFKRHVIEKLVESCESFDSNTNHEIEQPLLFQRTLINGTRWGGDLHVCNLWREMGGKIFCATELELSHEGVECFEDSAGAFIRRSHGTTMSYVANRIKDGEWSVKDIKEAIKYTNNKFTAPPEVLSLAIGYAKQATGPILETGSGLSTVLMAAATDEMVFCIENDDYYAQRTAQMARAAGVTNIAIVKTTVTDGSYDLQNEDIPKRYSILLHDGPNRRTGCRKETLENVCDLFDVKTIISDDADNKGYREYLENFARQHAFESTMYVAPRAHVMNRK